MPSRKQKEHDTSRRVDHANDAVNTGSDALAEMPVVWPRVALAVLFGTQPKGDWLRGHHIQSAKSGFNPGQFTHNQRII